MHVPNILWLNTEINPNNIHSGGRTYRVQQETVPTESKLMFQSRAETSFLHKFNF